MFSFALRHPVTTLTLVVALFASGILALSRMRIDIFPPIDLPQIYVVTDFGGMDPSQMESLIVNRLELEYQLVDGIREIDSHSIQQIAMLKLSFYPGTDMSKAMATVVSQTNRAKAKMPPNVNSPLIVELDAGSVPIGYLVLKSKTSSYGEIGDYVTTRIRPLVQKHVPGTFATAPFGTSVRTIVVKVDPGRLRAYNLTPDDVVSALVKENVISPSGSLSVQDSMPLVPSNAMLRNISDFDSIPLKLDQPLYLRDVGTVIDATDVNYGAALVNGRQSVYVPIVKKPTTSTIEAVNDIHRSMHLFREALPPDVDIDFAFDASPTVLESIYAVGIEGAIGAVLTGLMILLFLRDWRSALVVVLNIPLSLLGAMVGLWLTGATINIMTLGGLALSIGILVDMSTVLIEDIHVQMGESPTVARAVERACRETAVPLLLILLSILCVFIPAFIMREPVRSLFKPLALAVAFSLVTAYLLSTTFVPVLSVWLLNLRKKPEQEPEHAHEQESAAPQGFYGRLQHRFGRLADGFVRHKLLVVAGYAVGCALILGLVGWQLGTELFPQVDTGQFALRFRAPPGSNYHITRRIACEILRIIQDEVKPKNVEISLGYGGQQTPIDAENNLVLFMHGPDEGVLRVALKPGCVKLMAFEDRLRKILPERIQPWLAELLEREGLDSERARSRAAEFRFGFEPGDIIAQVMSFGSDTPVEIVVASHELNQAAGYAQRLEAELKKIDVLRDVHQVQNLDYPTVPVEIDRQRAALSGLTVDDVTKSVLVATSSSRYVTRNYWRDAKSGVDYQVEVMVPSERMDSPQQIETVPLLGVDGSQNLLVRDVARVTTGTTPGQVDRSSMQRYVSLTANVVGTDLGRAAQQIDAALERAGNPPRGVRLDVRGQIQPMHEMFRSLAFGMALAVGVVLVMLTAYFESWRMAIASISSVPGVLCGVGLILLLTGSTLNIESFMGAIMSVGVSLSNSVMLISFIGRDWSAGRPVGEACAEGARERLRPILMTAGAMTMGMVPMALALERGSGMQAPLGRAVIGGLVFSTFITLLVVPAVFAALVGKRDARSASLHPNDPASRHFDEQQGDDSLNPKWASEEQPKEPSEEPREA